MDIRMLHKEGHSIKEIARQTGRSRNTVRRILRETGPAGFKKPERGRPRDLNCDMVRTHTILRCVQ